MSVLSYIAVYTVISWCVMSWTGWTWTNWRYWVVYFAIAVPIGIAMGAIGL